MFPCKEHVIKMHEAIKAKGLGPLISKDSWHCLERALKTVNKEYVIKDPVTMAWVEVFFTTTDYIGDLIFETDEDENPLCPLCQMVKYEGTGMDKVLIEMAASLQAAKAREEGLLNNN